MTKMLESGVDHVVQNWHKKVCFIFVTHSLCHIIYIKLLNDVDMWLILINSNSHWTMVAVDLKQGIIHYSDSMGTFSNAKTHLALIM